MTTPIPPASLPGPWIFYTDDSPTLPYIGADKPYPTMIKGMWRYGYKVKPTGRFLEALEDRIRDFQATDVQAMAARDAYYQADFDDLKGLERWRAIALAVIKVTTE